MLELILLTALMVTNGQLARKKGHPAWLWILLTLIAYFAFYLVLGAIVILVMYKGPMTPEPLSHFIRSLPETRPLTLLTLPLLGAGGGLLIRFIIERLHVNDRAE